MRNTQSQSKLLGVQSAGKQNRVTQQKELRQAQRQQQMPFNSQIQDFDMHYLTTQAPRTVKNSVRTTHNSQDSSLITPAGPSSTQMANQRSSLQAARVKMMSQGVTQQSNLFGGLSRHVINASATSVSNLKMANQSAGTISGMIPSGQHVRGNGSTGYLLAKPQLIVQRQTSQHNANYATVPTSPTGVAVFINQPCGRTLAAIENMNRSQQLLKKVTQQQQCGSTAILPPQILPQSEQTIAQIQSQQHVSKLFSFETKEGQQKRIGQQLNEEKEEFEEPNSFSQTRLQMQPQPVPHTQFLSPQAAANDIGYSTQNFSKRSTQITAQVQQENQLRNRQSENNIFNSFINFYPKTDTPHTNLDIGSEQYKSPSEQEVQIDCHYEAERMTTPEVTTPVMKKEDPAPINQTNNNWQHTKINTAEASVGAHLCCHEQAKQHAVLLQKVQFMTQQISDEKKQAKNKEDQFNKMIAALKLTAEENLKHGRKVEQAENKELQGVIPGDKEWKDTLDELNKKKEQVNNLEEQVLEMELKAEKQALDTKIRIQAKDDEIGEERLKLRHKESDLRQANAQIERLNEDIQARIQEALDRQSDRLAKEKQADLDAMNRRNEQLIQSLVASHSTETRSLREQLLQQERKTRNAEHQISSMEISLQSEKLANNNRFDHSELEEIQNQNFQLAEFRIQAVSQKYQEENQQLKEVIVQLEDHINQLQESKSEADRKLIIVEDKISEIKKEVSKNMILLQSQKVKEEKMQQTFKAQIAKERKTADVAVKKLKSFEKLEEELNKKQILINQLKAKILELERDEMHKSKILLMKRRQIEDEKTVLIKKQAMRQRSMTKSNLSATRLQQQLQSKDNVIQTERESKKALQQEKSKLEQQIKSIKRAGTGAESNRHNESMSMYFVRSQGMFSPRNRGENTTKSFITNANKSGSVTQRQQVFMSQQQYDRSQLYLSKQFSNERTSSVGRGSLQGGDSMVNIVEFEENRSPQSRGRMIENNSMLSTPFKQDEPIDGKLNFKTQAMYSQSVLAQARELDKNQNASAKDDSSSRATPIVGAGMAQYQTHGNGFKHFKTGEGKKLQNIENQQEAEFIQVLSGCASSNESLDAQQIQNLRKTCDKTPGKQMQLQGQATYGMASVKKKKESEEQTRKLQEIKLIKGTNKVTRKKLETSGQSLKDLTEKRGSLSRHLTNDQVKNTKASPSKIHLNMASLLADQRTMIEGKESFARIVATQRCAVESLETKQNPNERQFDNLIHQKNLNQPQTARNISALTKPKETPPDKMPLHEGETDSLSQHKMVMQKQLILQPHTNIRKLNRNKTQSNFLPQGTLQRNQRSPISKTPLNCSNEIKEMSEQIDLKQRLVTTDQTPLQSADQTSQKMVVQDETGHKQPSSFNGLFLHQLQNMTSSVGLSGEGSSNKEEFFTQNQNRLLEENNTLKEQLELVKNSLAKHQQMAATTEITMMEAIMQMKDQIQQVLVAKTVNPEEPTPSRYSNKKKLYITRNQDYLVMSRNSAEEVETQTAKKSKHIKTRLNDNEHQTPGSELRKTNSVRERCDTFDLTMAQAESMYKKIKIKSPNKRAVQGSFNQNSSNISSSQGNFYKQTASSAMKRQTTQNNLNQAVKQACVSNFNQQQTFNQQQILQQSPSNNASFYTTQINMKDRLSVGVLKQSAQQQSVKKMQSATKNSMIKQQQQQL